MWQKGCVCVYTVVSKAGWSPQLPRELFKSIDSPGAPPPEVLIHRRSEEGSGEGIFQVKHGGGESRRLRQSVQRVKDELWGGMSCSGADNSPVWLEQKVRSARPWIWEVGRAPVHKGPPMPCLRVWTWSCKACLAYPKGLLSWPKQSTWQIEVLERLPPGAPRPFVKGRWRPFWTRPAHILETCGSQIMGRLAHAFFVSVYWHSRWFLGQSWFVGGCGLRERSAMLWEKKLPETTELLRLHIFLSKAEWQIRNTITSNMYFLFLTSFETPWLSSSTMEKSLCNAMTGAKGVSFGKRVACAWILCPIVGNSVQQIFIVCFVSGGVQGTRDTTQFSRSLNFPQMVII